MPAPSHQKTPVRTATATLKRIGPARGFCIAAAAYSVVMAFSAPTVVGRIEDDGVYLSTAKSLADGRGYRHASLPGEPYQTKYPVLYPAMLSLGWRAGGSLDAAIFGGRLLNAVAATAGLAGAYVLMRRVWRVPRWLAASAIVITATHADWWDFIRQIMSEHVFGAFAMAGLAVAAAASKETPAHSADAEASPGIFPGISTASATTDRRILCVLAAVAGVLAGAAYLSRSIGLAAVVAVATGLLLSRRRGAAILAAAAGGAFVAGWLIWQSSAENLNRSLPQVSALAYDLSYESWIPEDAPTLFRVIFLNTSRLIVGMFAMVSSAGRWLPSMASTPGVLTVLAWTGALATLGLAGLGAAATYRRSALHVHLFLGLYFALVLVWPFDPARFLIPVLPLIVGAVLAGLHRFVARLGAIASSRLKLTPAGPAASGASSSAPSVGFSGAATLLAASVLVLINVGGASRILNDPYVQREAAQQAALAAELRSLPPGSVIASTASHVLALRTEHKAVPLIPAVRSTHLLYAPDARFSNIDGAISPAGIAAHECMIEQELTRYYEATGVTHVVCSDVGGGVAHHAYVRRHPERFQRLRTVGGRELFAFIPGGS